MLRVLKDFRQVDKVIEIQEVFTNICRTGNISMIAWNGRLKHPFEEKVQLRKDYLS